jgi:hypothetical protein
MPAKAANIPSQRSTIRSGNRFHREFFLATDLAVACRLGTIC